jgi:hypothetical protein
MAEENMHRLILNINGTENAYLALRAARYLIDNPNSANALLDYGDGQVLMWAKRNKSSISVWEQSPVSAPKDEV